MTDHPAAQPHAQIEEISDDVFWVQGSMAMGPGMRITRNMTIVRQGEELSVISSVRLSQAEQDKLDKLGRVRHVIKIGWAHGYDDQYYIDHYGAAYWALPGAAREVDPQPTELMRPDNLPIADAELFEFHDAQEREAALLIKRGAGILITCDAVQNWPDADGCSLLARAVTRALGLRKRPAQIGPPWRKRMTPEGGSLKADFTRLADLPFEHLIGGHGRPIRGGAREALKATVEATYN